MQKSYKQTLGIIYFLLKRRLHFLKINKVYIYLLFANAKTRKEILEILTYVVFIELI